MRIAARWIWDGEGAPYEGAIELDGDRIAAVSRGKHPADVELGEAILMPGLVNAHVHLDLTFDPPSSHLEEPFGDWLLGVRERRLAAGPEGLETAAANGVQRTLAHGTTLLVDYDSRGYSLPAVAGSPIRRVLLREVIGFTNDLAERAPQLIEFLDGIVDPVREARGLAPHAPYTVHPELIRGVIAMARERGVPWSMHVAELPAENDWLRDGTGDLRDFFQSVGLGPEPLPIPGCRTTEYLDRNGWLADGALLIHGNDLNEDDLKRLHGANIAIVCCPRSHAWFGRPPHPLDRLVGRGIEVVLGTDGMLSSGELSMLEEARAVRLAFPAIPAVRILEMITTRSRRALVAAGVPAAVVGPLSLRPGQPADLAAFRVAPTAATAVLEELVTREAPCVGSWIAGEPVAGAASDL